MEKDQNDLDTSFLNFIVEESGSGYNIYIVKYRPDTSWISAQFGAAQWGSYSGDIIIYNDNGTYISRTSFENGVETSREVVDPCDNSGNGSGGGSSSGGSGPGNGQGSNGSNGTGSGGGATVLIFCGCAPSHNGGSQSSDCTCTLPDIIEIRMQTTDDDGNTRDILRSPCLGCIGDCVYGFDLNCDCLPEPIDVGINIEILAYAYDVENPDHPIADINEFLECFDTSSGASATITVYATEPIPGSGDTHDGSNVGHTFVSIEQGSEIAVFGYYPISDYILPPFNNDSAAVFGDDGVVAKTFTASISATVNGTALQQIIDLTVGFDMDYHLNHNNCTDYALEVGNQAGMGLPECNGMWPGGGGSNPGTLGEHIRNRPADPNFPTQTNTGSTAPLTNKSC